MGNNSSNNRLVRPKPTGLRHATEVCGTIPRVFKNVPWSKGWKKDEWVLVEVQSVVTDRVISEL
jgi:hypothetical protein